MSVTTSTLDLVYDRFQPQILNPVVTATFSGTTDGTEYTYIVTSVGDTGETNGTTITVNGVAQLSSTNYITLSWAVVENAKSYNIYGRVTGSTFGFLTQVTGGAVSFVDYGVIVPNTEQQPPATNNTGRTTWESVAFLPGRGLQSAELNEIQSILANAQEALAQTIFVNGDIISGCGLSISGTTVNISSGQVFIRGRVRNLPASTVTITGNGTEIIGIEVTETYIDATDDSILLDPAQNYPGYATAGALREILQFQWVVNGTNAIPVYQLMNGALVKSYQGTQYTQLQQTLARRTMDISGDVIINGLELTITPHPTRRDTLVFSVAPGKAYVNGYEVYKPMTVSWDVLTATQYGTVSAEIDSPQATGSYIYNVSSSPVKAVNYVTGSFYQAQTRTVPSTTNSSGWYTDTLPYASIASVVGLWNNSSMTTEYTQGTQWTITGNVLALNPSAFTAGNTYYIEYYYYSNLNKGTRSMAQQTDTFATNGTTTIFTTSQKDVIDQTQYGTGCKIRFPIVAWLTNSSGATIQTYVEGVDFTVDLNRTATSIGQATITFTTAPATGNTLNVSYYYWEHTVEGDYVSVDSYLDSADPYGNYFYEAVKDPNIVDLRTAGNKPSQPNIIVGYTYFLPQMGYVLLDKNGNLSTLMGNGAISPIMPTKPKGLLAIYQLKMPAFSNASSVAILLQSNYNVMKIYDMNVLAGQVSTLQYNLALAMTQIGIPSSNGVVPNKGIFVDNFSDTSQTDTALSTISMDTVNNYLLLDETVNSYTPVLDTSSNTTANVFGKYVTKNYTRNVGWIQQLVWTEGYLLPINPFSVFGPLATVSTYPENYYWYEQITETATAPTLNLNYYIPWNAPSIDFDPNTILRYASSLLGVDNWRLTYNSNNGSVFNYTLQQSSVLVNTQVIPELPQMTIYFRLFSLPNEEFNCTFGGMPVVLSLPSQAILNSLELGWTVDGSLGTVSGNLITGSDGWLTGQFTIPPGSPGGTVPVLFSSIDGRVQASSTFTGYGVVNTFKNTTQSINVDIIRVANWTVANNMGATGQILHDLGYPDPLAETFIPDQDFFIESIDLWFVTIPATEQSVVVSIKETSLGMPTTTVLGRSAMSRTEIASQAGISLTTQVLLGSPSETNGMVRFVFDPPVYVQGGTEYAFSIDNSAPGFSVFGAVVGNTILGDLSGVMQAGGTLETKAFSGVMLESSNALTWESVQNTDIMFRINSASFNTNTEYYQFLPISLQANQGGAGDMVVLASEVIPNNTQVIWQYSPDGINWTDFAPIASLNETDWVEQDNKVEFGQIIDNLYIRAGLATTSSNVSPVIVRDNIKVIAGIFTENGVYTTVNTPLAGNQTFSNIQIWFWFEANGGTVTSMEVSFDAGTTWYTVPLISDYPVATVAGTTEYNYGGSLSTITNNAVTSASSFQMQLKFASTVEYMSPKISKFRAVVY